MALVVAGWLGAAAVATGVALAAVSSIGAGIFGNSAGPLEQQQVADALAALPTEEPVRTPANTPTSTPTPSATPDATSTPGNPSDNTPNNTPNNGSTEPTAEPEVITSPGGTVVARCTANGRVEVLSWSPAQGYRVDDGDHGPAREVEVEFESGEQDVEVKVRCAGGVPDAAIESDD